MIGPTRSAPVLVVVLGVLAAGCAGDSAPLADTSVDSSDGSEVSAPSPVTTTSASSPASSSPTATTTATTTTTTSTSSTSSIATTTPACGELQIGVSEFTLTAGGAEHPVRVFVPSTAARTALPLVVNWHGLGGDGPQQAAVTRYEDLAESEGFIVVHPTGVPSAGDARNSWQLAPAAGERDDVAFADELFDHLIAGWCADPDRIYSTGMSNGGFFTARLVCEMADRLAAASSVGGLYHPEGCKPSRPVPYIAYHGTDDMVVPFDGDGESVLLGADSDPALQVFFEQVMPEEFLEFAADAGCDPSPSVSTIDDVIRYDYSGCLDDTPMTFFEVTGGGHTWPNWPIAAAVEATLGDTTTAVDATADSWEFFRQHTLAD